MKRTLWAAFAVLLGLGLSLESAHAGGDYRYYAGAQLYAARANAPIYDCPRPGCQTDIKLIGGSYIYAICWDGGEGWCRVQTRYFKNMFLPRYAVDAAYSEPRYKSYYYREGYHHGDGCKSYPRKSGCYSGESDSYYPRNGYAYKERRYKYRSYSTGYGHKRAYGGESGYYSGNRGSYPDDEDTDGYDRDE